MTIYVFETMTRGDAASFTADDSLTFSTNSATATQVAVAPYSNNQGGSLGNSGISLTYGGKTLVFTDDLAPASQSTDANGGIQFRDGSHLVIGDNNGLDLSSQQSADATTLRVPADATGSSAVYGMGGSDRIEGGDGNNYLYGGTDDTSKAQLAGTAYRGDSTAGNGGDTIVAGNGNNHIYGNALTTTQGQTDGNDYIIVGSGSNYINGNAGNDFINVGVNDQGSLDDSTGSNRVFGGSGNDFVYLHGAGVNSVNGNTGDDFIYGGEATGNNMLRGGNGNDEVFAGRGQDVIQGDIGNDTLYAGGGASSTASDGTVTYGHLTIMTGGAGADTFDFRGFGDDATDAQGDAGVPTGTNQAHSGIIVGGKAYYQTITDFQQGTDTIHLFGASSDGTTSGTDIVYAQAGVTFKGDGAVQAAEVYARQILDNHALSTSGSTTAAGEVAAIDVNGNTYLFYHAAGGDGGDIDSIIQLTGVKASTLSQSATTPTFS